MSCLWFPSCWIILKILSKDGNRSRARTWLRVFIGLVIKLYKKLVSLCFFNHLHHFSRYSALTLSTCALQNLHIVTQLTLHSHYFGVNIEHFKTSQFCHDYISFKLVNFWCIRYDILFTQFSHITAIVSTCATLVCNFGSITLMIQEHIIEFTITQALNSVGSSPSFNSGPFEGLTMNPNLFLDLKAVQTSCCQRS